MPHRSATCCSKKGRGASSAPAPSAASVLLAFLVAGAGALGSSLAARFWQLLVRTLRNFGSALFMSWAFGLALVLGLVLVSGLALALRLEALAGQTRR